MSYALTPYGKTRLPLPGVPWRDLSDEEYAAAVARHPGMESQGYFVEVAEDEPQAPTPTRGRNRNVTEEPAPPAEEDKTDG